MKTTIKFTYKKEEFDFGKLFVKLGLNDRKDPAIDEFYLIALKFSYSQKTLAKAIIEEMVGEEKKEKDTFLNYSTGTGGYNIRIKEEKAKAEEILKELNI